MSLRKRLGDEASTMNESDDENAGDEDMDLAAGAGEVLENIEDNSEILGRSAGAGEVLEQAENEPEEQMIQTQSTQTQEDAEKPAEPEIHWGYTNLGIAHVDNHLNIREEPNENGKLIGKLSKDAACEILEIDENGWAHIKSGKVEGYCSTEFLYLGRGGGCKRPRGCFYDCHCQYTDTQGQRAAQYRLYRHHPHSRGGTAGSRRNHGEWLDKVFA